MIPKKMIYHYSEIRTLTEVALLAVRRPYNSSAIVLLHFDLATQWRRDSRIANTVKTNESAGDRSGDSIDEFVASQNRVP